MGVEVAESEIGEDFAGSAVHGSAAEDPPAVGKIREEEVFSEGQSCKNIEFLLDDLDTVALGLALRVWRIFLAIQQHGALGWRDQSCDHFAEGAFAGPVGPQKRVDLSWGEFQADLIDRARCEIFRQGIEFQHLGESPLLREASGGDQIDGGFAVLEKRVWVLDEFQRKFDSEDGELVAMLVCRREHFALSDGFLGSRDIVKPYDLDGFDFIGGFDCSHGS